MSVIATALKHMLAAGMPHDAIVAAVSEMEAQHVDVAAERRRAADRERKARVRGLPQTSAEYAEAAESADPFETKVSPTPPSKTQIPPTPSAPKGASVPKIEAGPWDADELFGKAWAAYPQLGRERSSRKLAWPFWQRAAKKIGAPRLALAVVSYVANDKQHRGDCGPPAFHRWLRDEKFEHWLEVPLPGLPGGANTWTGPARVREEVVAEHDEAFARAYLDPAEWIDPEADAVMGSIVARNGYAFDKLAGLICLRDQANLLRPGPKVVAA